MKKMVFYLSMGCLLGEFDINVSVRQFRRLCSFRMCGCGYWREVGDVVAKPEFVVGVEEFYCAGLAVADYVVQVQFVVEGECLGFVLVVMLLLHYNIYMQYKYICNTNIYAIQIYMQYKYICNTNIYAIQIYMQYKYTYTCQIYTYFYIYNNIKVFTNQNNE
jgi:hypothetical protein